MDSIKHPRLPDYGCILRWPEDGTGFIHPEDIEAAKRCMLNRRVFRRDEFRGGFYYCSYGEVRFRLRSCLWFPLRGEGLDIGDYVETVGVGMVRDLLIARIEEMHFDHRSRCIRYRLQRRGKLIHNRFLASDLRLLGAKQQCSLIAKENADVRIEPDRSALANEL